jgi:hypothetical protein
MLRNAIVSRILRVPHYSDTVAREQGQVRFNVGTFRKFFVFNEEHLLHFRNCGVCLTRQEFDCPLLLQKDLRVRCCFDDTLAGSLALWPLRRTSGLDN